MSTPSIAQPHVEAFRSTGSSPGSKSCEAESRQNRSVAPKGSTRAVRAGIATDIEHRAVVPPLHLSANFAFDAPGECGRYDYTRSGNPTRPHLADTLASLEGGADAVVTASGMAAVTVVLHLVGRGEVVVAPHDCYGGTQRLLKAMSERVGFAVLWLDLTSRIPRR